MTTRAFSIIRRRSHVVDLLTPKRAGVKTYRIQAAATFAGPFVTIVAADISSGYLDPNVNSAKLHAVNNPNDIRIVFDPDTFTATAGIADNKPFWLKFQPVDFAGSAGTASAAGLILTDSQRDGSGRVVISGNAPSAGDVTASLQLDLPRAMQDFYIRNYDGSNSLYVAFEPLGSEIQVPPNTEIRAMEGAQSTLLVRGGGGIVAFSASFTNYLPL